MKEQRNLEYYLNLKYPYTIEEEEENGEKVFVAEIPDLPGCGAQGSTLEELRENLEEAKTIWIEESWKRKLDIPEPSKEYSGRILLRIPPVLHGQLNKRARQQGVSLNQFIRNLLETRLDLSNILERLERIEREIQTQKEKSVTTMPLTVRYFSLSEARFRAIDDSKRSAHYVLGSELRFPGRVASGYQCVGVSDKEGEEVTA